jgi:hypothetical protein
MAKTVVRVLSAEAGPLARMDFACACARGEKLLVQFATTPEVVASATVAALRGRPGTIWVPGRLRLIFAILRHLPREIYRRRPL